MHRNEISYATLYSNFKFIGRLCSNYNIKNTRDEIDEQQVPKEFIKKVANSLLKKKEIDPLESI